MNADGRFRPRYTLIKAAKGKDKGGAKEDNSTKGKRKGRAEKDNSSKADKQRDSKRAKVVEEEED
jgi:hypothetical protein